MKNAMTAVAVLLLISMQDLPGQDMHEMHQKAPKKKAIAVIAPTAGNTVRGVATFEESDEGVSVVVNLTGLTPGKHGFHVHEFGDVSSENGSSAGGHFNPAGMAHSMPMSEKRHAGDMGNVEADQEGKAHLEYLDPVMKLSGEYSIVGRAVIVHEKEDDLKTQPTGNAGARIGQGVIGIAK